MASATASGGTVPVANSTGTGTNPVTTAGAHFGMVATVRTMKFYPITDSELDSLDSLTATAGWAFTLAGTFLGVAFTLYLEDQVSPEATPAGELLLAAGPLVCFSIAIVSGIVGLVARVKRGGVISRIRRESKVVEIGG